MNRSFLSGLAFAAVTIMAAAPATVFALGSGGGGSVPTPTCSADVWQCSDFGACSATGYKYRTCTKTFDCPTTDTAKPSEIQTCTAPVTAPKPTPVTNIPPAPASCTADTYKCTDYDACDKDGIEHRTCTKTAECATIDTPSPAQTQPCSKLQCGDLPTAKARITCRLGLSPAGLKREFEIKYLPEECQAFAPGDLQNACIRHYLAFKPCWAIAEGAGRFACAAQVLQVPASLTAEADRCKTLDGSERTKCESALREKGFAMIKFRMYDLEKRAEDFLAADRLSVDQTATFIAGVYEQKAAFNTATTIEGRRAALLATRELWQQLVTNLKR